MRNNSGVTYIHGDHLGSATLTTDGSRNIVEPKQYEPYGLVHWSTGILETDYRFTGQQQESNIGLYDYGARFYDNQIGRFISADTIVPGAGNPQALNRYAYSYNNPLTYVDPSGHSPNDYYTRLWQRFEQKQESCARVQARRTNRSVGVVCRAVTQSGGAAV